MNIFCFLNTILKIEKKFEKIDFHEKMQASPRAGSGTNLSGRPLLFSWPLMGPGAVNLGDSMICQEDFQRKFLDDLLNLKFPRILVDPHHLLYIIGYFIFLVNLNLFI